MSKIICTFDHIFNTNGKDTIIDSLDITELLKTYKSFSCPAYCPRMLLKVVFYAYMNNIYSCRKIETFLKNIQMKKITDYEICV